MIFERDDAYQRFLHEIVAALLCGVADYEG
jgi:hypothetical protein